MSSQLEAILDRIHAVNTEIRTVYSGFDMNPQRYYPRVKDIHTLPMITPIFTGGQHNNTSYGSNELTSIWTIQNVLWVDNFLAGSSTADAQSNAEKCIDHIVTEYWKRPRLELESSGAFDCIMEDARLTTTGEITPLPNSSIAMVRFTLVIESTDDFERL